MTEKLYKQLLSVGPDQAEPGQTLRQSVRTRSMEALPAGASLAAAAPRVLRFPLPSRSLKWVAVAAAVALVLFGASALLPRAGRPGSAAKSWWLEPPAAWAGEIRAALDGVKGLTCREVLLLVDQNGNAGSGSTWMRYYESSDSYRRDIFDGDKLREIQWYAPDQNHKQVMTSVRFDTRSYFIAGSDADAGHTDPVKWMQFLVGLMDKAERVLEMRTIDGRQCVGFQIRASQYGSNPESYFDRIWFDTQSKLPVLIEECGRPVTGDATHTFTLAKDQFDYAPALTADIFVPKIPEGFVNAHPDELKKK